ncbi:MAG: proline--tRNA ligase [Pseudonocardiales bacterium]|nr:MAG: proline--tRNA ligase [Pseudonocardiales bacterium]
MASVLTPQATDFPRWYQDVVAKAELAENGPVRGTQVIRPWGTAIWEAMQAGVDTRIKAAGAMNVNLPLFLPESYLHREAEHVEGFAPEVAVVTYAGGKQLEEPVVVRPTSETLFGECMARWVQSYRDLPMLLNQWCNVVRWEMRTRLFLRSSEFLWQEGHTAHATVQDASAFARQILYDVYRDFMVTELAMPVVVGRKTGAERFPGAVNTMACEAMMVDGKALQMGTSHELGQNFARAFEIDFSDAAGQRSFAWTTSWGVSTRMVGGLIMCHGDDAGLRLPPRLAPTQVVVVAVKDEALEESRRIAEALRAAGTRVTVDTRTDTAFGRRAVDWELKGVPVRVELGPRDLAGGVATLVRRIEGTRDQVPLDGVGAAVEAALIEGQQRLYDEALDRLRRGTAEVSSIAEALEAGATGWATLPAPLVLGEGEQTLAASGITVRTITRPDGSVPDSEDEPDLLAYVGRSY